MRGTATARSTTGGERCHRKGERQAAGWPRPLADSGITQLYASPYLRCVQTLEPLGSSSASRSRSGTSSVEGPGAGER